MKIRLSTKFPNIGEGFELSAPYNCEKFLPSRKTQKTNFVDHEFEPENSCNDELLHFRR